MVKLVKQRLTARKPLRAILAQSATGAELIDPDALVVPDTATAVARTFADRYLIEPADPNDDPDDIETVMKPTPAGRRSSPAARSASSRPIGCASRKLFG